MAPLHGVPAPPERGAGWACGLLQLFGQNGLASARSSGKTVTGTPFCHCAKIIGTFSRRPFSSNLIGPGNERAAGPVGQVHLADRLGDLELVGGPGGLQRLLQDPGMAVAAQRVLRRERLAGALLEALDEFLLALQRPVGDAEQTSLRAVRGRSSSAVPASRTARRCRPAGSCRAPSLNSSSFSRTSLQSGIAEVSSSRKSGLAERILLDQRRRVRQRRREDLVDDRLQPGLFEPAALAQVLAEADRRGGVVLHDADRLRPLAGRLLGQLERRRQGLRRPASRRSARSGR